MNLTPDISEQLKHYASVLNKSEAEIKREIEEWGKNYPAITNEAARAQIWASQKNIALPLKQIIQSDSEKYYLIHNLSDLAKSGKKGVNIRGFIINESPSLSGNPKVILADESGIVQILVKDKEKWNNLTPKVFDPIYIESLNIWQPEQGKDRFVYQITEYSNISRVQADNTELKMPATSDIKTAPIGSLKEKDEFAFIEGWITGTRNHSYLGCSNCRTKASTGISEGQGYRCFKCNKDATAQKNQIRQLNITDGAGDSILCSLPPNETRNIDLMKGLKIGIIGTTKQRDSGPITLQVSTILEEKESKSLEQQLKNAASIGIKYFDVQVNSTVEREEFSSFLKKRFSGINSDDLIDYMIKNHLILQNGAFLSK